MEGRHFGFRLPLSLSVSLLSAFPFLHRSLSFVMAACSSSMLVALLLFGALAVDAKFLFDPENTAFDECVEWWSLRNYGAL